MVKGTLFRIVSAILLIVAMITFSGIAATASALHEDKGCTACCSQEMPAESPPCPIPDCPCPACMTAVFQSHAAPTFSPVAVGSGYLPQSHPFYPDGFGRSIDYPPEA